MTKAKIKHFLIAQLDATLNVIPSKTQVLEVKSKKEALVYFDKCDPSIPSILLNTEYEILKSHVIQKNQWQEVTYLHGYKVIFDCICNDHHQAEGEYGSWSADYSTTYNRIEKSTNHPDVVSTVDLTTSEGFLVWVNWGSGDSFGHASGKHYEALGIFETQEYAKDFIVWLEEITPIARKNYDNNKTYIYTKNGQIISFGYYLSWSGYFDSGVVFHIEQVGTIK